MLVFLAEELLHIVLIQLVLLKMLNTQGCRLDYFIYSKFQKRQHIVKEDWRLPEVGVKRS